MDPRNPTTPPLSRMFALRVQGLGCLWSAVALVVAMAGAPLPAVAAPSPLTRIAPSFKQASSAAAAPAASPADDDIDRAIALVQSREDDLRLRTHPDGIPLAAGLPIGATPAEYQEWQHLTSRTIGLLDRRLTFLRYLKDVRQSVKDLETSRKGWRGFPTPPPYPMSFVDSLQDVIKAQQNELQTHEVRLNITEREAEEFAAGLRESQTQRRLAEERLERSEGKSSEERSRWLLALATRHNDLNETGVVMLETQRQLLNEEIAWCRQKLAFLDEKLALAIRNVRFSKEELAQKLTAITARREQVTKALDAAIRSEAVERGEQERARAALERYKDESTSKQASPRLVSLRQALEVQQARVETAGLRILALKVGDRLLQIEGSVWEHRYQLANKGAVGPVLDLKTIQKDQETFQSWKNYVNSRLDGVASHIRSQQSLLSSPGLPSGDEETARILLAAYQEQKDLLLRVDEELSGTGQLLESLAGEMAAHTGKDRRVGGSLKIALVKALDMAGKVWNTDLYVAEETVIIDGQKIVKTRSVTVGKVIQALLILVIGLYVARKAIIPLKLVAVRKFQLSENDAHVFSKVAYYLLFICILVFSLVTVKIPLAVFAFFGGALAIGIGFGAQTIINNFISGLILLFDRSVRLNDVVEVDGQRGRVTAINIRSSRIKRFDGIEMLVPNSLFLQNNVINLTLSDPFTRYDIAVGIAYGTPTRAAEETILRAVVAQPQVRTDPAPFVAFEDFADSSLNFRAFFWLDLDSTVNSLLVRSEIRHRIAEYLAQANIEIPFPQRDLHLHAEEPLTVTLAQDGPAQGDVAR